MHEGDGGSAAGDRAENQRVEAAAQRCVAELSDQSETDNPSITDPAISQWGGGTHGGVQRLIDWGFFEDAKISENFCASSKTTQKPKMRFLIGKSTIS